MPKLSPTLLLEDARFWADNIGISMEAHGVCLADENTRERPAVGGMIVIDQEISYQNHGLDRSRCWLVEIGTRSQCLVSCRSVELCRLLSLPEGCRRRELRAHGQHGKDQCHQCRVRYILIRPRKGPEVRIIGIESLSVNHGINRVDTFKVHLQQEICLHLVGHDRDNFCQSTLACPIIGKGVFRPDSKHIGS